MITAQPVLVFFLTTLDSTNSSNIYDYLLPTGAKRAAASPVRAFVPAAEPETGTAPCPLQLTQATTKGAAIPKLEYVPTRIPTTKANEKLRRTSPPIMKSTRTVRKVRPLVRIVRDRVWLIER